MGEKHGNNWQTDLHPVQQVHMCVQWLHVFFMWIYVCGYICVYVCVAAPGCSPAGIPGQSSQFLAGQSGPERPAAPGSDGRCGSSGHPSAAAVSLAVDVITTVTSSSGCCDFATCRLLQLIASNDSSSWSFQHGLTLVAAKTYKQKINFMFLFWQLICSRGINTTGRHAQHNTTQHNTTQGNCLNRVVSVKALIAID